MYGIGIINFELVFSLLVNISARAPMKLSTMGRWTVTISPKQFYCKYILSKWFCWVTP